MDAELNFDKNSILLIIITQLSDVYNWTLKIIKFAKN